MGCSQGALSKLLIDPTSSFDASSERYDYLWEDVVKNGRIIGARSITGTRSGYTGITREGQYTVGGRISMYTSPADLDNWLPRVLGAAESSDDFALDESIPAFYMLIDRVGAVFQYNGCYVDRAVWRGSSGPGDEEPELVEQILTVIGQTETLGTSWPSPEPSLSVAANRNPYSMAVSTLTVNGVTYQFNSFVLMVDNHVRPRWVNSLYATALCPADRTVILRVTVPFTSADDAVYSGLYYGNSITGVDASLVFTNTNVSTTFTFTGLQWAQSSPHVEGKKEINLEIDFIARRTGSSGEIEVTNDSNAGA